MNKINIAAIEPRTSIYGPGTRYAIWVQGCKLQCKGCWNKSMWPLTTKKMFADSQLYESITRERVEGITLLGGEPLHQSRQLLPLCKKLKKNGYTIMLYTGYEEYEIKEDTARELLELSDIVVMGRYVEELRNTSLRWRGSSNQKIVFHNQKYEEDYLRGGERQEVEVHFDADGTITIIGYPDEAFYNEVLECRTNSTRN
jgi:anaerobic ribonucleoside-triphosphate reductase activating protein